MKTAKKREASSAWQRAIRYGIDVSIIDANLKKAPTERALTHQAALEAMLAFREAGAKYYASHSKNSKTSHR